MHINGLKQEQKKWHEKFDNAMITDGFKIIECDSVYILKRHKMTVILCLYVDDILIVGSDDQMVKSTKITLNSRFNMEDMRLANVILGIKILRRP